MPYSLVIGMSITLVGLLFLAGAPTFAFVLVAATLLGIGSAIFHPESSRVARMAAGVRPGLAQSLFQVGGNTGSSLGPLLAAFLIVPRGQASIAWCALLAVIAMAVLWRIGGWCRERFAARARATVSAGPVGATAISPRRIVGAIVILCALLFSKYFYLASLSSYYTFYLIERFHLSVQAAQVNLFIFLFAVAAGTILGGPVGDRIGRKRVIWASIFGVLPFTLLLPVANLVWTTVLSVIIGLVLASAFAAIVVYAQELVPGRIGLISGVFFGFAFGMGGLGAAVLGRLADAIGIVAVYRICAFLPAIGALAAFLPEIDTA
jgi:FSR family fosmidomycin resistance protein-like MFS transporter